jgi:hypothetical protein
MYGLVYAKGDKMLGIGTSKWHRLSAMVTAFLLVVTTAAPSMALDNSSMGGGYGLM